MTRVASFWAWFQSNESSYRSLDGKDTESLLDSLQNQLQKVSPDLWFEVGGHPDGPRELVISAEGKVSAFPLLREVVRAAPDIPGWVVVAFKQPQGFDLTTEYGEITISPNAAWFLPLVSKSDPNALGVRVGYAHYKENLHKQFLTATYIALEAGLGELAAAMQIQHVQVCILPSKPEDEGFIPLRELPTYLERRGAQIVA